MSEWTAFTDDDAARWIAVPAPDDDKYSRGVLGAMTGSTSYPGAAVLSVQAAHRTGVGMVRYLGPRHPSELVLARRPEVVTADGRVQAWVIGSGIDERALKPKRRARIIRALESGEPAVIDAGVLGLFAEHRLTTATGTGAGTDTGGGRTKTILTPHFSELVVLLGRAGIDTDVDAVKQAPADWAVRAAEATGAVVLLKGTTTYIADPHGARLTVSGAPSWLATAGSGDVLGGALGALVATHRDEIDADARALAPLAATGALLHARAAEIASGGGPIAALDVADALGSAVKIWMNSASH
jgi:hydroxyethylthiazole kinase-like uncharacterized protein yjeF